MSRSLSALRGLYQYLISVGAAEHNPARKSRTTRSPRRGPQVLTNKEIELLLAQPSPNDLKGIRDKAMLELLYATALRSASLFRWTWTTSTCRFPSSSAAAAARNALSPSPLLALKALTNYLEFSRRLLVVHPDERALFVNVNGDRMTRQGFLEAAQAVCRKRENL